MENFFPPSFELVGRIRYVEKKEPTAMRKTPAMKLFIQHGPRRMGDSNRETNFLNGMYVRVPFYVYSRIVDKLVEGQIVQIKGHLQGVHKPATDTVGTELVAERIAFQREAEPESDKAAVPETAEPATSAE